MGPCPREPKATRKLPQLTEHAGPVTQHPPLLGAVGRGRLLQGLFELAVSRQQGWDPLGLHGADTWGQERGLRRTAAKLPARGCVLPTKGPGVTAPRAREQGEGPAAGFATFHVHLGGLHNFLVDHKVGQLFEKDGTGVDVDRVIEEGGLQREGEWCVSQTQAQVQ